MSITAIEFDSIAIMNNKNRYCNGINFTTLGVHIINKQWIREKQQSISRSS